MVDVKVLTKGDKCGLSRCTPSRPCDCYEKRLSANYGNQYTAAALVTAAVLPAFHMNNDAPHWTSVGPQTSYHLLPVHVLCVAHYFLNVLQPRLVWQHATSCCKGGNLSFRICNCLVASWSWFAIVVQPPLLSKHCHQLL